MMNVLNLPMGERRSISCEANAIKQKELSRNEIQAHVDEFLRNGGQPTLIPATWDHLDPRSVKSATHVAAELEEKRNAKSTAQLEPTFVTSTNAIRMLKVGRKRFKQMIASGELAADHHVGKKNIPLYAVADLKHIISTLGKQNA